MTGKRGKAHHAGTYGRTSARIRAAAWADPTTRCWRCHRTITEVPPHTTGRAPRWTAGHIVDGQVDGDLAPECSLCAASTGAQRGNHLREPRSEHPYPTPPGVGGGGVGGGVPPSITAQGITAIINPQH